MQKEIRKELEYKENESLINRLNNYIGKVDSEWIKRIRPSNKITINKLLELVKMDDENLKLPDSFMEFIKSAGENDGGLLSETLHVCFSFSDLIEIYDGSYDEGYIIDENGEYIKESYEDESFIENNLFEFLIDEVGIGYKILLDNDNYGKIRYEDTCYVSSSFEKLLFQCAIKKYEKRYHSTNILFGSSINSLRESAEKRRGMKPIQLINKICKEHGLKRAWFSDEYFYYTYSDTVSIFLVEEQLENDKAFVGGVIYGENKKTLEVILDDLLPKIGAKIQKNRSESR